MTGYVKTTGVLFALITVAHVLRMFAEPRFAADPWYLLLTLAAAGFTVWAWRVLPRRARSLDRA